MTGYNSSIFQTWTSEWTCFLRDGDYIMSKANSQIYLFGTEVDAYLCQLMTKITSYSYYYYIEGEIHRNANNDRMSTFYGGSAVTLAQACAKSAPIRTEEFHVLVKSTNMADVKQWLPTPLLGTFEYTKVTSAGVSSCGTGSVWDVCNNRTTMTFNMTQCNSVVAYSQGKVYGVFYVTKGSTYYVVVVNPGTVDNSKYFRFTCMAVTQSGTTVTVVEKSGSCGPGQNTTVAPSGGSKYTLTPYVACCKYDYQLP
ncbi:uncharacterized protein LOC134255564 [Saccostrea cucullata]|uniref:uncharacterized protein LOC134255564 n=1 Tax=Saccostrea cuccullata TaxID=36930 RepID=UPI002ED1ADEB